MTREELDQVKQAATHFIEMNEAYQRLLTNADFNKIVDNYTKEEPVRLVHLLADASLNMSDKHQQHRQEINETLLGIARFTAYLRHIPLLADRARNQLEDLNDVEITD